MSAGPSEAAVEAREWLIQRRGLFYRTERCGYTSDPERAGLYTKAEADAEAAIEPENFRVLHMSRFDPPLYLPGSLGAHRAALIAAERAAWQDIATAPRDGSMIVIGAAGEHPWSDVAFWHDGTANHWKREGFYEECYRGDLLTAKPCLNMTMWRPLPEPSPPPDRADLPGGEG